jgi:hypothetical protein
VTQSINISTVRDIFTMEELKYDIKDLAPIVLLFVVLTLLVGYGMTVQEDALADLTAGSDAYDAANNTMAGTVNITSKMPTIGKIIGAAIIIGIVVTAFYFKFK